MVESGTGVPLPLGRWRAGTSTASLEQKLPMSYRLTVVWSEPRTPWPAQEQLGRAVLDRLAQAPEVAVAVVPHLYDLAPDGAGVEYLRSIRGPMLVLAWLYPRAAFWLLDAHGVSGRMGATAFFPVEELPEDSAAARRGPARTAAVGKKPQGTRAADQRTIWCIDLRDHERAEPLVAEVERIVREATGRSLPSASGEAAAAPATATQQVCRVAEAAHARWYPVVDYSRCDNCLECLNFCLFGVFDTGADESLLVVMPDQCRTGCPACARVCPAGAIMFPMHSDPAIAGDPRAPRQGGPLDLFPLLGPGAGETAGPRTLAAAERAQAVRQSAPSGSQTADAAQAPDTARAPAAQTPGKSQHKKETTEEKLDRLVDELDQLDQSDP